MIHLPIWPLEINTFMANCTTNTYLTQLPKAGRIIRHSFYKASPHGIGNSKTLTEFKYIIYIPHSSFDAVAKQLGHNYVHRLHIQPHGRDE